MKNFSSFLTLLLFVSITHVSLTAQTAVKEATMMDSKAEPTVIQLSQTEGVYETTLLNLVPGDYIFEVTNRTVNKDLGFYLVDGSEKQVKNSGLANLVGKGETSRTGVVTLSEGSFQYSCPLNPTPHYTINVSNEPRVIKLNQTEGVYETAGLNLPTGFYVFEVTNLSVDKDLGFYLVDENEKQVTDSGLSELVGEGQTSRTGLVFLSTGEYQYSCPLNPTPHYTINVQ